MEALLHVVLVIHLLGWAVALGGTVAAMRRAEVPPGALHGVLTAVVTGLALVTIAILGLDAEVDNAKIGIKLVVGLVAIGVLVALGRRPERVTRGNLGAVAGLISLNVALAVLL